MAASLEETETTEEISSIGNSEDSLENVFDSPQAVNQSGDSLENNKVKTVGINEEFGNSTITGVVTDVDMNYTEYNDFTVQICFFNDKFYHSLFLFSAVDDPHSAYHPWCTHIARYEIQLLFEVSYVMDFRDALCF